MRPAHYAQHAPVVVQGPAAHRRIGFNEKMLVWCHRTVGDYVRRKIPQEICDVLLLEDCKFGPVTGVPAHAAENHGPQWLAEVQIGNDEKYPHDAQVPLL